MNEYFIEYRVDDETISRASFIREDKYADTRAQIVSQYGEGAIINENAPKGAILLTE